MGFVPLFVQTMQGDLTYKPRGSLVSLHLGASPRISRFGEFLIQLAPLDRIGSFSQGISSSSFIT